MVLVLKIIHYRKLGKRKRKVRKEGRKNGGRNASVFISKRLRGQRTLSMYLKNSPRFCWPVMGL